ncbi:hypothetical protein BpHYR1_052783 [Brachionus plicatilis]|uniref:Uncharacterized protein n=1 Tax=Brachionus plicatilis TaxID=10195 RepID=A0A3M7T1G6_BRAPC|nr:hypothetical protein BpHYR1_052783 [Brachionus plicatilis]
MSSFIFLQCISAAAATHTQIKEKIRVNYVKYIFSFYDWAQFCANTFFFIKMTRVGLEPYF